MVEALATFLISLRWVHVLAGITWIGILYYFNFVQVATFRELDANVRTALVPTLVKRALFWFRWAALITVLAGWTYFFTVWISGDFFPLTGRWWSISILAGGILGTMMLLNVWGIIWVYQKRVIASTEGVLDGKEAPAEMGTWGKRALIASRFNTAMSLPMLFFMVAASHFPLI